MKFSCLTMVVFLGLFLMNFGPNDAKAQSTELSGNRLVAADVFDPRLPHMRVYVDNDPCASKAQGMEVVASVQRYADATSAVAIQAAANSANQKYLTSLRPACWNLLKSPFSMKLTILFDGIPVLLADIGAEPSSGRPLPIVKVRAKTELARPESTHTELGTILTDYFSKFGALNKQMNPDLDVEAAIEEAERLEATHPRHAEILGNMSVRLYEAAQDHPLEQSAETKEKLQSLSMAGSGSASNRILRNHYFELYDIARAVRDELDLSPELQKVWSAVYPAYVEGLQYGSFASHDVQQALIIAGARITPNGFEYEVYDGPRLEDVERGLTTAAQNAGTIGAIFTFGRFAEYENQHFSCDGKWCDIGANNAKWRLISQGRPVCVPSNDESAQCRFPWRINVQLDTQVFGGPRNPYQRMMTNMNAAEWFPGEATFRKSGGRWNMVGMPTLENPN